MGRYGAYWPMAESIAQAVYVSACGSDQLNRQKSGRVLLDVHRGNYAAKSNVRARRETPIQFLLKCP